MKKISIGEAIRRGRMNKGWNQKSLAQKINVDPSLISRWESNIKIPPGDILIELVSILEVTHLLFPIKTEITNQCALTNKEFSVVWNAIEQINHKLEQGYIKDSTVIEKCPFAVVVVNQDNTVLLWNPVATEILGWEQQEVLGKPMSFLSKTTFKEFPFTKKVIAYETLSIKRKNNEKVIVCISGGPLNLDKRAVIFFTKKG